MELNAFEFIRNSLQDELTNQGFQTPVKLDDENGVAEMFATDSVAYSILYDKKRSRFELRSTTLEDDGKPGDWKALSMWLFDESDGTKADLESISNDFLEIIRGPKRVDIVQKKRKRGKDEDKTVDPLFFLNRLVNIFPDLKQEMNDERILYGQIRYATFATEKVTPKCEDLLTKYAESEPVKKLCELLSDHYINGDKDVRSIITFAILNKLSETTFDIIREKSGDDLKKASEFTRKLREKQFKPEKKKKEKKVVAKLER